MLKFKKIKKEIENQLKYLGKIQGNMNFKFQNTKRKNEDNSNLNKRKK